MKLKIFLLLIITSFCFHTLYADSNEIKVLPTMFYSYSTASTGGGLYVFEKINDTGVYLQFRIYHSVDVNKNCNLWRIIDSYLVNFNGTTMTQFQQILTGGENEFVWKSNRTNVGDFTGGFHGDERIDIDPSSKVTFYADGVSVPTTTNIPLTVCSSFYYQQFSSMHQTGTGGTDLSNPLYISTPGNLIDCFHEKRTVFENKGYTCYNKVTWNADVPINLCYYGIFCVNKDISSEGFNQYGTTAIFASDGSNKLTSDKQQINMLDTALGTSVVSNCSIVSLPFTPSLITWIWDTGYHKYYSKIATTTSKAGDVWDMQSSISFDYSSPTTEFSSAWDADRVKISVSDNKLQVTGLLTNESFCLFNSTGKLLRKGNCNSNSIIVRYSDVYLIKLDLIDGSRTLKFKC